MSNKWMVSAVRRWWVGKVTIFGAFARVFHFDWMVFGKWAIANDERSNRRRERVFCRRARTISIDFSLWHHILFSSPAMYHVFVYFFFLHLFASFIIVSSFCPSLTWSPNFSSRSTFLPTSNSISVILSLAAHLIRFFFSFFHSHRFSIAHFWRCHMQINEEREPKKKYSISSFAYSFISCFFGANPFFCCVFFFISFSLFILNSLSSTRRVFDVVVIVDANGRWESPRCKKKKRATERETTSTTTPTMKKSVLINFVNLNWKNKMCKLFSAFLFFFSFGFFRQFFSIVAKFERCPMWRLFALLCIQIQNSFISKDFFFSVLWIWRQEKKIVVAVLCISFRSSIVACC